MPEHIHLGSRGHLSPAEQCSTSHWFTFQMWTFVHIIVALSLLNSNILYVKCDTSPGDPFHLDGTFNSYLQYKPWNEFFQVPFPDPSSSSSENDLIDAITDVSISFEFKCNPVVVPQSPPPQSSKPIHNKYNPSVQTTRGLLLYADSESSLGGRFIEIKLLSDDSLRLRIDDQSRPSTQLVTTNILEIRQTFNFSDGEWHRIELIRHHPSSKQNGFEADFDDLSKVYNSMQNDQEDVDNFDENNRVEYITLKVDKDVVHKKIVFSDGKQPETGRKYSSIKGHQSNGSVFIGGIPRLYQAPSHLTKLAMPLASFETHFRGSIRNVHFSKYSNGKQAVFQPQKPMNFDGILNQNVTGQQTTPNGQSISNACTSGHEVCHNGGQCFATNNGTYCDCSITDYEGAYCQKGNKFELF